MKKVLDYLKQLDLSDIEANLYLTLLKTGPISVRELAETIEIKRTTAYVYIDQLVERHLIMKLVKGSKKLVAANPPESLKPLVDKKAASAKIAQEQFPDIVQLLTTDIADDQEVDKAEIRYYKGQAGIMKIYEEALRSNELRLYVNLTELEKIMIPNSVGFSYSMFEDALKKDPGLNIYEIVADTPGTVEQYTLEDTAATRRYFFRFMPNHVGLTSPGILLYDNKVAIINVRKQLEMVVLYNTDYYMNSKRLFEFIWSVLPDPIKKL
jgi:sugar-specific transcriptional regulator TrmB